MIDYYHELPDMTALNDRGRSGFRNHPAKGRESGKGPSRNRRDDRKDGVENGYTAISINLGSKDKVAPPDLIGLVNQSSRRRGVDIGRIKISASRSTLQVEDEAAEATAHALNGFTYRGRKVRAQLMDGSGGHDRAPSKGKGHSGSRPSKEQRREHRPAHASARASSGSDAKRSGQLRYGRKPLDMDD
jgi:ATP-dependent RNA helicase DeaD